MTAREITVTARPVDRRTRNCLRAILARYRRYGWSAPEGEWGELQARHRTPLRSALDIADRTGDLDLLGQFFARIFRTSAVVGLVSLNPDQTSEQIMMKTIWCLALWAGRTGRETKGRLRAPNVGEAVPIMLDGEPLMVDTPRHDAYAARIVDVLADTLAERRALVIEIGGGYGGLALQLLRQSARVRVAIIDLPDTLYISSYWLTHAAPDHRIAWWEDDAAAEADVVLVPAQDRDRWWTLAPVVRVPDLVCSMHALCEMPAPVSAEYLAWLGRTGARYFYHDDAAAPTGEWDETLVAQLARSVPPEYRLRWRDATPWSGLGDRYSEFLYERTQTNHEEAP